jgi:acyl-ACP thioesterase
MKKDKTEKTMLREIVKDIKKHEVAAIQEIQGGNIDEMTFSPCKKVWIIALRTSVK